MTFNVKNICTQLKQKLIKACLAGKDIFRNRPIGLYQITKSHAVIAIALAVGLLLSVQIVMADSDTGGLPLKMRGSEISGLSRDGRPNDGINSDDRYLLARVIEGESADEPLVGKVAVGAVVLNRVDHKDFPKNLKQVVYQPLAFEAVANGQYNRPLSGEAFEAADLALKGWDPTSGSLYYWNPAKATSKWVWQKPVTMKIGNHVFAR
ncbi:MAG: cell wall hydrolase [Desulfocucumaceae bacterium]